MIVTFCGHSTFIKTAERERELLELLEKEVGNARAQMFLGGYGSFDSFAYECCKKYKATHPNTSLVFVTPYLNEKILQDKNLIYDSTIYPPIEDKPLKFAITYRNKYMVEAADLVIAYISRSHGGAYITYKYAKRLKKPLFNLSGLEI